MFVRDATPADLPAILAIHNHAIRTGTAIWDEATVDLADRRAWLTDRRSSSFPVLVAEVDDQVAGYASYGAWRTRSGYRHTVEHSVYVDERYQRRGIATTLLAALIERADSGSVHAMVGAIESSNLGSIALHERLGFRTVGTLPEVGTKFGRWLDLTFLQLTLAKLSNPSQPFDIGA